MSAIAIMGATGHTGSQIASQLAERGIRPLLIGRNRARLDALAQRIGPQCEIRLADPTNRQSLDNVFRGVNVVINTVGPFSDLGEPVVQAALEQGSHYIDTTGEQAFMERIQVRYNGPARNAGLTVIPALAFEYALGTCAADIGLRAFGGRADRIETFYRTGGGTMSHGTAQSIARVLGQPMRQWREGRLQSESLAAVTTEILFPGEDRYRLAASFGGGIALAAPELGAIGEARSFMVVTEDMVTWMRRAAKFKAIASLPWTHRLADRLIRQFMKRPEVDNGPNTRFQVAARITRGARSTTVRIKGSDPYAVTAALAAEGAVRLSGEHHAPSGVICTPRAFESQALLDAVASHGVSWEKVDYG